MHYSLRAAMRHPHMIVPTYVSWYRELAQPMLQVSTLQVSGSMMMPANSSHPCIMSKDRNLGIEGSQGKGTRSSDPTAGCMSDGAICAPWPNKVLGCLIGTESTPANNVAVVSWCNVGATCMALCLNSNSTLSVLGRCHKSKHPIRCGCSTQQHRQALGT